MLSSRCEQNALVGIFTRSESHFLYDPFLEVLFLSQTFQWAVLWLGMVRFSVIMEGMGAGQKFIDGTRRQESDGLTENLNLVFYNYFEIY